MPPKGNSARGQGAQRARGRGGGPSLAPGGRGPGTAVSRGGMGVVGRDTGRPSIAGRAKAIGLNRPDFGTASGRVIKVVMNSYRATVPDKMIYQYAVGKDLSQSWLFLPTDPFPVSDPPIVKLPVRLTQEIFEKLKTQEGTTFHSHAWFDGRAIMYAAYKIPLGDTDSKEFHVPMGQAGTNKAPRIFKLKISKAPGEINPENYTQFIQGQYSHDEDIQMLEMAINTMLRAVVSKKYVCNKKSFFTSDEKRLIGGGLEIRRGFFHSYRPSISGPLINFDISTAVFYQPGPFIALCLSFLGSNNVSLLDPQQGFNRQVGRRLEKFLANVRIATRYSSGNREKFYTFRKFSNKSASGHTFEREKNGRKEKTNVAAYFKELLNKPLQHPKLVCVDIGKGNVIPIELFEVVPGQFARVEIAPDQTKQVVEFSTKKPEERFKSIKDGFEVVAYGRNDYVKEVGITIDPIPVEVDARILTPPVVKCSPLGKESTARVANGKWNMLNRKFVEPVRIAGIIVAVFEPERYFGAQVVNEMMTGFVKAASDFGMVIENPSPVFQWLPRPSSEKGFTDSLKGLGKAYVQERASKTGHNRSPGPGLLFAVLPPNSADLYNGVKRFGDVTMGIPTQCLLSTKCKRGNHQYWANVSLKVNVKVGGVNFYPALGGGILDPANPTIIMGADTIHPPPGTNDKPSVTAVVSSIDSNLAKYIAETSVQQGRREIIADMRGMCGRLIGNWKLYQSGIEKQKKPPTRLIVFRDGVSEGEFKQVLDDELPLIRGACEDEGVNPKITLVIVGKRHHHRAKPKDPRDGDNISGNLPAGATIDTDIVHPLQFDYLQWTHGGLLGTSRPGHYIILHDENDLKSNGVQALSFGLAHSFARATCSVSIPAPVYYADIVCARKGIYFDYEKLASDQGSQATSGSVAPTLEDFQRAFSKPKESQARKMFFM